MHKTRSAVMESVRSALARPIELEVMLSKAGQKDRTNVEKHLAALETVAGDATHGQLWKRLARAMGTLAPLAITTVGQQNVQFFIADGKYRMQVFAIEDQLDGKLVVYIPDVLDQALKLKLLLPAGRQEIEFIADPENAGGSQTLGYPIAAARGQTLRIERLDAANTPNPAPHYKNMLGWNRKALRIVLPVTASATQVEMIETLASLAARAWEQKQPAAHA